MFFILNRKGATVGVLSNDIPYACPYWNDHHVEKLAYGEVTLEFDIPTKNTTADLLETEGFIIYSNLDGGYELFKIKELEDTHNATFITHVYCEGAATSELLGHIVRPITFTSQNLSNILESILDGTGWELGHSYYDDIHSVSFKDYPTALEALHTVLSTFDAEVEFRCELNGAEISKKVVNVYSSRGDDTGKTFEFGKNLTEVIRKEESNELVTAMVGVGKPDKYGNVLTIVNATNAVPDGFEKIGDAIADNEALQKYTSNGEHVWGVHRDEVATTANQLFTNTLKALKQRNKPHYQYSTKSLMLEQLTGYEHEKHRIGDTIIVKDTTFTPPVYLSARIIEKDTCKTDKAACEIVLGEYKEIAVVYPSKVKSMQLNIAAKVDKTLLDPDSGEVIVEITECSEETQAPKAAFPNLDVSTLNIQGGFKVKGKDVTEIPAYQSKTGSTITVQVDEVNGKDDYSWEEVKADPSLKLASLQYALDLIPSINHNTPISIQLLSDINIDEDSNNWSIQGYGGGGELWLDTNGKTIKGRFGIQDNSQKVKFLNTSTTAHTKIINLAGDFDIFDIARNVHVEFYSTGSQKGFIFKGSNTSNTIGAYVHTTTMCDFNVTYLEVQGIKDAFISCYGSNLLVRPSVAGVVSGTVYKAYSMARLNALGSTHPASTTLTSQSDSSVIYCPNTGTNSATTTVTNPTRLTKTVTLTQSDSGNWRQSDNKWGATSSGSSDVIQGMYGNYGEYKGLWLFNLSSLASTLATLTSQGKSPSIAKVRLYLTRNSSGGSSSSQTAYIHSSTSTSIPSNGTTGSEPNMSSDVYSGAKFKWGESKWVDISSIASFKSGILANTIKGFGLYVPSWGNDPYMRFSGSAKLEVTYTYNS